MLQAGTDSAELRCCLTIFIYFFVVFGVFLISIALFSSCSLCQDRTAVPQTVGQHKRGPEKGGEGESPLL